MNSFAFGYDMYRLIIPTVENDEESSTIKYTMIIQPQPLEIFMVTV